MENKISSWEKNALLYLAARGELITAEEQLRQVRHVILTDPHWQSISRREIDRKEWQLQPYYKRVNRAKKNVEKEQKSLLALRQSLENRLKQLRGQETSAYRTANPGLNQVLAEFHRLESWLIEQGFR